MFKFHTIFDRRQQQLKNQETIDRVLACLPCQELVSEYLLFQRERNRLECQKVKQAHFWEIPEQITQNMDDIDREQERFQKNVQQETSFLDLDLQTTCQKLQEHLEKIKES